MDENIQNILNAANLPQTIPNKSAQNDPISSILSAAGVGAPTSASSDTSSQDFSNASSKIGNQDENGYCETFAEQMANLPNMGATAADAWDNFVQKGKASADVSKAPGGSLIYFSPDQSNGYAGHVAITDGKGNIIGATYNGVQPDTLENWMNTTGQKPLGYVVP
jgi:hypothetical protein